MSQRCIKCKNLSFKKTQYPCNKCNNDNNHCYFDDKQNVKCDRCKNSNLRNKSFPCGVCSKHNNYYYYEDRPRNTSLLKDQRI